MLKRACIVAVAAIITAGPAAADSEFGTEGNKDGSSTVTVRARDGSSSGGGGSGAGAIGPRGCQRKSGEPVSCSSDLGWWSSSYNCYLSLVQAAGESDLAHVGEGLFACNSGQLLGATGSPASFAVWLPMGSVGPDPLMLAQEALDSMQLRGIDIGTAPPSGTAALVNLPVWLWVQDPGAATWGPISATASAGAVTVTATAQAEQVEWNMGDGASVTCDAGQAYASGADTAVPDCGYTYRASGQWPVTATTTWSVQWTSTTGVSGSTTLETDSSTVLDIREARAHVTGRE